MTRPAAKALALILLALGLSGCAAVAAGTLAAGGTYAYVTGWLTRDYPATVDKAYKAATRAASELGLTVDKSEKTAAKAHVEGRDADSTGFWIRIEDIGKGQVSVAVKVGILGDEEASRRIHEAMAKRL